MKKKAKVPGRRGGEDACLEPRLVRNVAEGQTSNHTSWNVTKGGGEYNVGDKYRMQYILQDASRYLCTINTSKKVVQRTNQTNERNESKRNQSRTDDHPNAPMKAPNTRRQIRFQKHNRKVYGTRKDARRIPFLSICGTRAEAQIICLLRRSTG